MSFIQFIRARFVKSRDSGPDLFALRLDRLQRREKRRRQASPFRGSDPLRAV